MEHPDTRVIVIVVGDKSDPATTEDAQVLQGIINKTSLRSHVISEKHVVNKIVYHLLELPGF